MQEEYIDAGYSCADGAGPEEVSGGPEEVSAGPEEVSGGPEEVSGGPEEVSGGPEEVSGGPEEVSGAAQYEAKCNKVWGQTPPYISMMRGDPTVFTASSSRKMFAVVVQGEKNVVRHAQSSQHKKFKKERRKTKDKPKA